MSEPTGAPETPAEPMARVVRLNEENAGLSNERTLLAWYRSSLSAMGLAVGVGKIVPALDKGASDWWLALGALFALVAALLAGAGLGSYHRSRRVLAAVAGDEEATGQPAQGRLAIFGALLVLLALSCAALVLFDS